MASYDIKAPDGTTYRIDAPDDASEAQVLAYAQQNFDKPKADNSAAQWAGVATRAASPYATMAGIGALVGGVPTGGIGAPAGAAAGVASLGIGDFATGTLNVPLRMAGYEGFTLPSDAIRNMYAKAGIGREPQTTPQRLFYAGAQGASGGGANAMAASRIAPMMAPGAGREVVNAMGQMPGVQAASGAGAGIGGQGAAELGYGPLAQFGGSLLGGSLGARFAAPRSKAPTADALKAEATAAYKQAAQAGVTFHPSAVQGLQAQVFKELSGHPSIQYHPELHPRIRVALKSLDELANSNKPPSFEQMELLRRVTKTAANSLDKDERRLGRFIVGKLDDFVQAAGPNDATGDTKQAATAITRARNAWSRMAKGDQISEMIERAERSPSSPAVALKGEFRKLANNPSRLRQFSAKEQAAIKKMARGTITQNTLQALGNLSPGTNLRGMLATLGAGGAGAMYSSPVVGGGIVAGLLGAAASKGTANRMASGRANNAAALMRMGGPLGVDIPSILPPALMGTGYQTVTNPDRRAR